MAVPSLGGGGEGRICIPVLQRTLVHVNEAQPRAGQIGSLQQAPVPTPFEERPVAQARQNPEAGLAH